MGAVNLKNKVILVTGGTGFLGKALVKKLKDKGAVVYTMSRTESTAENHFVADINNANIVIKLLQQINPDVVYHLAANLSRSRDFSLYEKMAVINVIGTLNILEAIKNSKCHLVFTSSSEVYGNNTSPFSEDMIVQPASPYSLTKVQAEELIKTFSAINKVCYTIIRLFNFYGPGMPEDFFVPQLINTLKRGEPFAMTQGRQIRELLYIDDVVEALLCCAKNEDAYAQILNVCSGTGIELRALAETVAKRMQAEHLLQLGALPYRDNEVWEMIGNHKKMETLTGFIPRTEINEGIAKMLSEKVFNQEES